MNANTSSHSPEDPTNRCPVCQAVFDTPPAQPPGGSMCPQCGHSLWFVQTSAAPHCYDATLAAPLEERLLKILCEHLAVKRDQISHTSSLEADLGADSLAVVELLMSVEEELGCTIPDEEAQKMQTVGDLFDYILRQKSPALEK
jgi:acyl carrier protein